MSTDKIWNMLDKMHAESVAKGEHDDQCEHHPGFYLCHCSKRERIAAGRGEPPVLCYSSPTCGECHDEVTPDGDGWVCARCHVFWGSSEYEKPGTFTDDYGPDLAGESARHAAMKRPVSS